MKRKLLFALMIGLICCTVVFAQQRQAGHAPQLQSDEASKDSFSNAAETLFTQGFADPRGLEYREIEIPVGNPWDGGGKPVKTHGWILPEDGNGKSAVAWNGLVYPVARVGAVADLHKDWASGSQTGQVVNMGFHDTSEAVMVNSAFPKPLQMALLLRLGEVKTVARLSKNTKTAANADPYLELANDWAWNAFTRAVCAHQRGGDGLALADARLLTKIQPLIEAEAKRRGIKPNSDSSNSRFPDRKLPYLPFLQQLPAFLADCERRVAQPNPSLPKNDIPALIDDLQNVNARQWGQPGGVSLAGDARVAALVKRGNEAVEPLLKTLENDSRLTRSVSFGRDFFRQRHLISVSEAAYAALTDLLRVDFKTYNANGEPLSKKQLATQIRAYWAKMGALSPVERFYATLKDDKAGKDQWMQAAANIVQPADVESHGGWITIPNRKPNQKIKLRGESLRDGRTPSVAQLLARRSDDIARIRTGSSEDSFLYLNAGQMALYLADWDKTAALPILKKRLNRAWSIGAQSNDILAFNGNPVERFGTMIAQMTLARARCGDASGYDEYAAWICKLDLKDVSFGGQELQKPLIQGAARPSIARAINYLFNDPKSPWSNLLGGRNGFWLMDFWQTPLPKTTGFRQQALRALMNKTRAGAITFNPRKDWNGSMEAQIELKTLNMGFRGSNNDPDTPPPGQKRDFRVCDAYAYFYSQFQHGPPFQLFWPEKKRDAGVLACRQWLQAK